MENGKEMMFFDSGGHLLNYRTDSATLDSMPTLGAFKAADKCEGVSNVYTIPVLTNIYPNPIM